MENTPISDLILYKNNQLIAFNKPAGMPVQPDKTEDKSLMDLAEIYGKSKVYLLHRIDRPVAGIVLFAKTLNALHQMEEQFRNGKAVKSYLAVVGQAPPKNADTLVHYLSKNGRTNRSEAFEEAAPDRKEAKLTYKVLSSSDRYHLLQIDLLTGRHHQIRAQLAAIGCPIKGDVKYGFRRGNKDRSIHLHAWKLDFEHPVSGEKESLQAPLPADPLWDFFSDQLV